MGRDFYYNFKEGKFGNYNFYEVLKKSSE